MAIIEIRMLKGYDQGERTRVAHALTDGYRMVIPAPPASITVMIDEIDRENYMRGGAMRQRTPAHPDPGETLRRFNTLLAGAEYDAADALLTDDCVITLFDGVTVSNSSEIASHTAERCKKLDIWTISIDVAPGPEGPIAFMRTQSSGETTDGEVFSNRRAIKRFEFRGALIARIDGFAGEPALPPEA